MDVFNDLFGNNKWQILSELAKKPQAPTDLALKTKTSVSNITQQLKILEAYQFVKKAKSTVRGSGKPKTIYTINATVFYGIMLSENVAEKKLFKIDDRNAFLMNCVFMLTSEDSGFVTKFCLKNDDILKKCEGIGFIKSSKDSVELFLLTNYLEEIRSRYSNTFIEDHLGKTKKIVNWTHSEFEVTQGLAGNDKHFSELIKSIQIVYDPHDLLHKLKQKGELHE